MRYWMRFSSALVCVAGAAVAADPHFVEEYALAED